MIAAQGVPDTARFGITIVTGDCSGFAWFACGIVYGTVFSMIPPEWVLLANNIEGTVPFRGDITLKNRTRAISSLRTGLTVYDWTLVVESWSENCW